MKTLLWPIVCLVVCRHLCADVGRQHSDPNERLGTISFPISCSAQTQKLVERGIALLHSFWFDEAENQFRRAASSEPACAMAYWAEALGLYRPLAYWPTESDMKEARKLLQKAKVLGPKSQRERDYVAALEVFFRIDKRDPETRSREYSQAMETVYKLYPGDTEAAVLYALSLLTWNPDTNHPHANREKAIAILNQVFRENPNHPGAAHYLIHASDSSPRLAQMALEAARRYTQIAPAAPHALHMPSHIFARLGLWQEDIRSNLASLEAARHPSGMHVGAENQLHAMEFLEYAYLQTGDDKRAEEMVQEQAAVGYEQVDKNLVDYLNRTRAYSPAMFALETRHWKDAEALRPDPHAESYNQAITYWARAVAAGHLRDLALARDAASQHDAMVEATRQGKDSSRAKYMTTNQDEVHSWLAFAEGKSDAALILLRRVADKQDLEGKGEIELPAREMLADMLLEMNRPQEALAEYEKSMKVDPNRFNGLLGTARAAELTGQRERARSYYAQLLRNCDGANSDRSELAHARAVLAEN